MKGHLLARAYRRHLSELASLVAILLFSTRYEPRFIVLFFRKTLGTGPNFVGEKNEN
jgi:hypothetical protein